MPVWFVYRSFDMGPTGKHVRRFDEDDTVLGWFQRNWAHLTAEDIDVSDARLRELVGCDGWFCSSPFVDVADRRPPESPEELRGLIPRHHSFDNEVICDSPHVLQVFTEYDGGGGAVYYFDGQFLKGHPGLPAYLLNDDWRLPSGIGDGRYVPAERTWNLEPAGDGPGEMYAVFMSRDSKDPLADELGPGIRLRGFRLQGLARRLLLGVTDAWPGHLALLPALMVAGIELPDSLENAFLQAVRADPSDTATWAAWSDYRQDHSGEPPGVNLLRHAFERMARLPGSLQNSLPLFEGLESACREVLELEERHRAELRTTPKSLIHVEDHLAQICLDDSDTDKPHFGQWILFDDLWASAHPDLANAILRFAARWDVLSPDGDASDE